MENRNLGGRPRKLQISLTKESIESMLQNIWNEAEETKLKAVGQFNKTNRNMVEIDQQAMIGKINADFLKLVNDASEKKLSCVKIAQAYIQKENAVDPSAAGPTVISEEEKATIRSMFNQKTPKPEEKLKSVAENQKYEDSQVEKIIQGSDDDQDITDVPF